MSDKKIITSISVVVFLGAVGWYLFPVSAQCPEDFTNSEEKVLAFDNWTKDFYTKNPDASFGDLADARQSYYKDNNCTEAIKRYEDYMAGRVDAETKDMVEGVIDELVYNSTRHDADNLGFRFIHSNEYEAISHEKDPETIVVFPKKYLDEKPEKMDAIIIVARENDPANSAMDWLESEYSSYNLSYGYKERRINGVDAYLLHWDNPNDIDGALFLSPDKKRRITISILGDASNKASSEEFNKIIDAFSFN